MHNASGQIDLALMPREFEAGVIDLWSVNLIASVLPTLDTAPKSVIECLVAQLDVRDGLVTEHLLVVDTTRMRVLGKATIDMKTETIDLLFEPTSKRPEFFSLATPVRVDGTFEDFEAFVRPEDIIGTVIRFVTSVVVVLGQPQVDQNTCRGRTPVGVREREELLGQAGGEAEKEPVLHQLAQAPHALREDAGEVDRHARVLLEERLEVAAVDRQKLGGLDRLDGGGPGVGVDQGDLPEDLASVVKAEHDLLAVLARRRHPEPSAHDAVELPAGVSLPEQDLLGLEVLCGGDRHQVVVIARREPLEEGDALHQLAPVYDAGPRHVPFLGHTSVPSKLPHQGYRVRELSGAPSPTPGAAAGSQSSQPS